MSDTRVYAVLNGATLKTRLVIAANAAQALRHVAKDSFAVSVPTTQAALALQRDGVEVETVKPDLASA